LEINGGSIIMVVNEETIRNILCDAFICRDSLKELKNGDDLRSIGLNSVTSIELIVRMEQEFNINILDEDLIMENVSSIDNIIQLLKKYINE
jgi:acyl carrier protein